MFPSTFYYFIEILPQVRRVILILYLIILTMESFSTMNDVLFPLFHQNPFFIVVFELITKFIILVTLLIKSIALGVIFEVPSLI